jgi:ketosteroid isomerase-like protein
MKNLSLLMLFAAALTACNTKPAVDIAKETQALLDADKDFCAVEQKQGFKASAEKYYDDEAVAIGPNQPVSVGKAAIIKMSADNKMDSMTGLSWKAEKAVVSASGDLGYVWGYYTSKSKTKEGNDTTTYGAYGTVYKKTTTGWKAVLDQNNDTPKP